MICHRLCASKEVLMSIMIGPKTNKKDKPAETAPQVESSSEKKTKKK